MNTERREIRVGETVEIKGRRIPPIPANHTVPAGGYVLESARAALVFSGDTAPRAVIAALHRGAA